MIRVAVMLIMDRNGLFARIVSDICERQSVLIAYLGVCLPLSVLSVYSLFVLDGSTSAYVLAQMNLAALTAFEVVLIGLLYVCIRR